MPKSQEDGAEKPVESAAPKKASKQGLQEPDVTGAGNPRAKAEPAPPPVQTAEAATAPEHLFPIVGVGASAGGLEAFTQLLENLPLDTGMGFVLVQHLAPRAHSMLPEILAKVTRMPVAEVKDGMRVEPNRIYVTPPDIIMRLEQGVLRLAARTEPRGVHRPIDDFLRSLAHDQGSRAIGVILSGTASDGVLGLQAIKAEGGVTFAQEVATAKYAGMPESAIAAGHVDFVLSPEKIARQLARLAHHPFVTAPSPAMEAELPQEEGVFNQILLLLKAATGLDFTYYKHSTIKRRINRRMMLQQVEKLEDYVRLLRENAEEVKSLYEDILINVTSFFREPEAFEALQQVVFPEILRNRAEDEAIRIWVPGCASGEEAYSLAISLVEFLGDQAANVQIQIFATDIEDGVIDKARQGIYPEAISRGCLRRAAAALFCQGPRRLPGEQGHPGDVCLRQAEPDQGPALLPDGPDQLPQRAHLLRAGAAKEGDPDLPFRPEAHGLPAVGQIRGLERLPRAFYPGGQETQNFFKESLGAAAPGPISDRGIHLVSRGARQGGPDRGGGGGSGGIPAATWR